ncbi:hypothetical protein B0H66DRAFT_621119 [Apodospora peruviana]|uniref:Uncharacterized protein n=1 Tax=Apodospora peruviana TaxID=516989 RepID=A0AAE0M9L2_9PEZI|nr:hypothetical protein B0H66DRAFT_621119 [Apodospora peruviana]
MSETVDLCIKAHNQISPEDREAVLGKLAHIKSGLLGKDAQDTGAENSRQNYLHRLSEFNAQLHLPNALLDPYVKADTMPGQQEGESHPALVTTDQLEQATTHVLRCSALFLDLLACPSSSSLHPRRSPSTAELHYALYRSFYDHLQQQERNQQRQQERVVQQSEQTRRTTRPATNSPDTTQNLPGHHHQRPPQFSLLVAGIPLLVLDPTRHSPSLQHLHTRFQLQIILQTSAHYLGCTQEELNLRAPVRLTALSPAGSIGEKAGGGIGWLGQRGSAEAALLGHMLMMQSQGGGTGEDGGGFLILQKMKRVLEKLRRDFGILVVAGST